LVKRLEGTQGRRAPGRPTAGVHAVSDAVV
jgi:hypothetical protein